MKSFIEILPKYDGIVGALLGVIVTMILTQWLKSFGKIRFYVIEKNIDFKKQKEGEIASYQIECTKEEAETVSLKAKIEIYNGSEVSKILRDIRFVFYDEKKKKLLSITPEDKSTQRFAAATYWRDELYNINILPKQILVFELVRHFHNENAELIKKGRTLFLEAKNHRGKKIKVLLERY